MIEEAFYIDHCNFIYLSEVNIYISEAIENVCSSISERHVVPTRKNKYRDFK